LSRILSGFLLATFAFGCGPTYVRDTDDKRIDEYAMSTRLDRVDLERLFDENIKSLMESPAVAAWASLPEDPRVAVFPIANETSEHIDSQLQALLSKVETALVNSQQALVISREQQDTLILELEHQRGGAFDPSRTAEYGRQLGASYFVTGKAYDAAERTDGERRVQYFLFMQLVEVETGAIRWQHEAKLTKALVD
jgi:uncharacterized protein (TIGR02722 family)